MYQINVLQTLAVKKILRIIEVRIDPYEKGRHIVCHDTIDNF